MQDAIVLAAGLFVLLLISVLKEKNINVLCRIDNKILPVRWGIYYVLIFSVLLFGVYGFQHGGEQFLYMRF